MVQQESEIAWYKFSRRALQNINFVTLCSSYCEKGQIKQKEGERISIGSAGDVLPVVVSTW